MSNMPVFYVDKVMYYLSSEEFKVLAYLNHKIVGDKIPFDGEQYAKLHMRDIAKGTGLSTRMVNKCMSELVSYQLIMPARVQSKIVWMMGPLEEVDLAGLAMRKQAKES